MTNTKLWRFFNLKEFKNDTKIYKELPNDLQDEQVFTKILDVMNKFEMSAELNVGHEMEIGQYSFIFLKTVEATFIGLQNRNHKPIPPIKEQDVIFQSSKMEQIMHITQKVALVDSTVLLLGETGVGKSLIAQYIHQNSNRNNQQYLEVNCSTIPESLIEAELFGYTAGSFTGGIKAGKKGVFESATGGTVFLDEIGEIPLHLQAKLLEVLQEGTIRPIGAIKSTPIDVRIIAATNRNLEKMVEEKKFREDLFYRLNVVPIEIPNLRARKEDIDFLIQAFLQKFNQKYQTNKVLSKEVINAFHQYDWPGNVRELENIIERLIVISDRQEINNSYLPDFMTDSTKRTTYRENHTPSLKATLENIERKIIIDTYREHGTTYKTAEALQTSQSSIAKKIKKYRDEGVFE